MTLRTQKLMLFLLVALIFMVLATPPVSFALQSATLSVDPASGTMTSPTYAINVKISNVNNLWAIHFKLSFNDGVDFLRVDIPGGVEPGDLMTTQAEVDCHVASIGGITYLDVTVLAPDWENNGTVTGEGSIAKITFKLMENALPEMTSWLKLEDADAMAHTGTDFEQIRPITLVSGTVTVGLLTTALTLSAPSTATVEKPITLSANLTDGGGNPIAGQTIDFYVNTQKWDSNDTNKYGVSSLKYTPTNVGTLSVQAVYNGSLLYAGSSSDTIQITVSKMGTTLTLDVPMTIRVGDTVDLIATLKKDTDPRPTPIVGATVNFSISPIGWTASRTTNSNGIASVKYTFNSVGYYEIKAEYLGTEKYAPSSDNVTRVVASTGTTLKLTKMGLFYGKVDEPTTISAILKDDDENLLANFDVDFYIYTDPPSKIGGTTDSSGIASVEYIPHIAEGSPFQVEAIYEGNLTYTASNALGLIWVQFIPTNLTLSAPTATVDKSTVITATLKDEKGNRINGQPVHFYFDALEIPGSPTTTDSNGVASINYTPTKVGTFQIEAMYDGSAKYAGSGAEEDLTVNPLATTLSLNVPTSARVEDEILLTATLKDQDGKPIPDSTIDYEIFLIGWNPLDSAVTNASGVASLEYTPAEAGTFNLRAKYGGDEKHTKSTSEKATLTVNKVSTTLTISMPNTATVQTSITISATLKDEDENSLPDSIVYYYIKEGTGDWVGIGSTPTNENGTASMNYLPSKTGTFKLKTTYKGDQKYAGSNSEETTLEVTSGTPETPEEPETPPLIDLGFLIDAELTILDILFWFFVIMSFSTLVVAVIWKKTKRPDRLVRVAKSQLSFHFDKNLLC